MEAGAFSIKPWESYLFSSRDPGKVAIQPPTPVNRNNLVVIKAIWSFWNPKKDFWIASVITIGKVKWNSNYRFQKLVTILRQRRVASNFCIYSFRRILYGTHLRCFSSITLDMLLKNPYIYLFSNCYTCCGVRTIMPFEAVYHIQVKTSHTTKRWKVYSCIVGT